MLTQGDRLALQARLASQKPEAQPREPQIKRRRRTFKLGTTQLPPPETAPVQLPAIEALKQMQQQYILLSEIGTLMAMSARADGQMPSCESINWYHKQVAAYRNFGQQIFNQLVNKGVKFAQVIYRDGKPEIGTDGNVRTVEIDTPLMPPTFTTREGPCKDVPGMVHLSGAHARLGQVAQVATKLAVPISQLAKYALGALLVYTVGKAAEPAWPVLQNLAVGIFGSEPSTPQKLDCFKQALETGKNVDAARALCEGRKGLPTIAWIGIGVGTAAVVGGAVYYFVKIAPERRARQEEIEAAAEEVESAKRRLQAVKKKKSKSSRATQEDDESDFSNAEQLGCPCAI